jgi:hypothetical protein
MGKAKLTFNVKITPLSIISAPNPNPNNKCQESRTRSNTQHRQDPQLILIGD